MQNTTTSSLSLNKTSEISNSGHEFYPWEDLSAKGFNITAVLLFLIMVFGFVNNLIVIVVIGTTKKLQTPMNAILLNLSISDFLISTCGAPLTFMSAKYHEWIYGDIICQLYAFTMTLTGMTSIGTLAAIAINRYIIISRSFLGQNLSGSSSTMTIVLIWLYSLSMALPPLLGWNRYIVEFPGIACSLDWQTPPLSWDGSYIIYIFVIGYVAPLLIMTFCYGRVVWMLKAWTKPTGRCTTAKAERKVTIMASVMVFCTVCAWTPYAVVSLMVFLKYEYLLGPVSTVAPAIFAKSSTVYNPIVYFFFNSQMREALISKIPSMLRVQRRSTSDISMETKRGATFGVTASINTQNIHVDGIATTENL